MWLHQGSQQSSYTEGGRRPTSREITKMIKKTKNRIFANPAAVPAMPVKPKTAATSAMMRKVTAQFNINLL